MKTNKFLLAMALPALLAACTADELVEQPVMGDVNGRAKLDSNFAVNVAGGVESRFSWDSYKWDWSEDDTFGAGLVDPITPWQASNQYMLGNYIFSQTAAGNWITDSQMTEGIYMFYSYDGYKLKNDRGLVAFDISSQKTDLDDPEALLNDAENQLFFSPLYNLEAEYSSETLPLEFRSFWGVAAFSFKNSTEQTLKITQIVLKEQDASNKFVVKGGINPAALQNKAQYVYNEDEEAYVPTQVNAVLAKANHTEKQLTKAYEEYENNLLSVNASIAPAKTGVTSSFIALDCQNYELEDGKEVTAYMLVPAHDGENIEVDIMVVDENGEAKVVHVNNSMVSDIKTMDILRDKTNAIFGKTTTNGIKTLNILKKHLKDDAGFYVSDNAELLKLLDGNHGKLLVHNSGDVVIDEEVSQAIREYIGTSVTFSQPITIAAGEALVDDAEEDIELALDGVIFEADVTIKGEDSKKGINGKVEFKDVNVKTKVVVEEGASLIVNKGAETKATVENWGVVTLEEQNTIAVDQKGGVLNLNKHKNTTGDYKYSTDYINFPSTTNYKTVVAEGVVLVVNEKITLDRDVTEKTMATLIVKGNVELNANVTVEGEMTVEGDTKDVNGKMIVETNGVLTTEGKNEADIIVKKDGTVYQNGTARNVYNEGLVIAGRKSKTTIVEGKEGRVDNTKGGAVTNDASQTVYYSLEDGDVDNLEGITFADWSINTLRIEEALNMNRAFGNDADVKQLTETLYKLEVADGAKIEVKGNVHVYFTEVILEGNAVVEGYTYTTSSLTFDQSVLVTMKNRNVKVGGDACYTLELKDVSVGGDDVVFVTESEDDKINSGEWNVPVIETEDATLRAEISKEGENAIVINGDGFEAIDVIGTLAGLKEALEDEEMEIINLHNSVINLDADLNIKRDVTINGGTLVGHSVKVASEASVTFDGVTFRNAANGDNKASSLYYCGGEGELNVKNCTFDGFEWDAIQVTDLKDNAVIKIIENTFKTPVSGNALENGSFIHIANGKKTKASITISMNTFGSAGGMKDYLVKVYGFYSDKVIVGRNKFKDSYTDTSVLFCRNVNYLTGGGHPETIWTNITMFNALKSVPNIYLDTLKGQLDVEHTKTTEDEPW